MDIHTKEWEIIHKVPFRVTKDSRIQWFQYRIINRILATNSFLFKIKKSNSKYCNLCHSEEESIEHILWECNFLQTLLSDFEFFLRDKTGLQIAITKKSFILGFIENNSIVQNIIVLWLKYYVYTTRCAEKSLNLQAAISHMKLFYETQKFISYKNGEKEEFDTQWNGWNHLFS